MSRVVNEEQREKESDEENFLHTVKYLFFMSKEEGRRRNSSSNFSIPFNTVELLQNRVKHIEGLWREQRKRIE